MKEQAATADYAVRMTALRAEATRLIGRRPVGWVVNGLNYMLSIMARP